YAMAAKATGSDRQSSIAISQLQASAVSEHGGVYWAPEQNTPFYGWGHAGRIESTAMVLLALSQAGGGTAESRPLIDQGPIWLLSEQDRYGVWYSGQATVDVLSALLSTVGSAKAGMPKSAISVLVNGAAVSPQITVASSSEAPVVVDISGEVRPGD